MFSTADTIVAIATPPGRGGIGVVRLSGPTAHHVARCLITHADDLEPRHATFTMVRVRPNSTGWTQGTCVQASGSSPRGDDAPRSVAQLSASVLTVVDEGSSSGTWEDVAAVGSPAASESFRADAIDQVVATYFPAPTSYTGEDVVELSAHGSPVILRTIVDAAMNAGARLAQPGEFTLRAFLNGRINLVQAEAVRDLIDAVTPLQARAAFDQLQGTLTQTIGEIDAALFDLIASLEASVDFPDEGYHFAEPGALTATLGNLIEATERLIAGGQRGRIVREGAHVAIVGKPNVGKSSVFNALVGASRAIVSDVPGTTRDLVTEEVDIEGLRVTLVDTAGIRQTADRVEAEGVERARRAGAVADLILIVLDGSALLDESDRDIVSQVYECKVLIVKNKSDVGSVWNDEHAVCVSATTLDGISALKEAVATALDVEPTRDRPGITNIRHIALVRRAREALLRAREGAEQGRLSEEFVLADLQDARAAFEEISGRRTTEDLLAQIFSRFCIGK